MWLPVTKTLTGDRRPASKKSPPSDTPPSSDAGTTPSLCEKWRDNVLAFMDFPLFSAWTLMSIFHVLLILGFGALFFFLLVGWHELCENTSRECQIRHFWYNVSIQVLTGLFTLGVLLTLPWRMANAHHLFCSKKSPVLGCDFYGRPTDAIWFHIQPLHRRVITVMLLVSTGLQLANQAMRCVYNTYVLQEAHPGSTYVNVFFAATVITSLVGSVWELIRTRWVYKAEPERFPPGLLEETALSYRKWRRGVFSIFPRAAAKDVVADFIVHLPGARAVSKVIGFLVDLPWLLADLVTCTAEPPTLPDGGPTLTVLYASGVPYGPRQFYAAVSVSTDGGTKFKYVARTPAVPHGMPIRWNTTISLGTGANSAKTKLKLVLRQEHSWGRAARTTSFVGKVIVTLTDLYSGNGENELLVEEIDGDPVLSGWPLAPCFIQCSLFASSHASAEATAGVSPRVSMHHPTSMRETSMRSDEASSSSAAQYPRHVFMMSRGTRGDVQPFVALARGLCNELGWLVTICTEPRWKEFVVDKCSDITKGKVSYVCSGGDTERQTSTWLSQQVMNSKAEALQEFMLAASEAVFFPSAPVFMHHLRAIQASGHIDLIINSFTLTGVALMCGERLAIPVVSFCLQPSFIPSSPHPDRDDHEWVAVVPVGRNRSPGRTWFTSHLSLRPIQAFFNRNPWNGLNLPALRHQHDLADSSTWEAVFHWQLPVVIPMMKECFPRPPDWPKGPPDDPTGIVTTDFIFLRSAAPGGGELSPKIGGFIKAAREQDPPRKLMVMTFSSMPVPRREWLAAAVEMLEKSTHDFALLYVGKIQPDTMVATKVIAAKKKLTKAGKLLEVERADFGVLFRQMDAFVVHGGLGTTVEALRMRKPVAVTGILLMDQRFWGKVCFDQGVGPRPVHIGEFKKQAVDWANRALDPTSDYALAAAKLEFGEEDQDGVQANVDEFARLMELPRASLPPPRASLPPPRASLPPPRASLPPPRASLPARADSTTPRGHVHEVQGRAVREREVRGRVEVRSTRVREGPNVSAASSQAEPTEGVSITVNDLG